MQLSFSKFEAAGNDFILLDNRVPFFPEERRELIVRLCRSKKGIGADGLILLQSSSSADFQMKIYNSDGSEAAMCGNGLRCLIAFLRMIGVLQQQYRIETNAGIFSCRLEGEQIVVEHPLPLVEEQTAVVNNKSFLLYLLDTGVPHAVCIVDDLAATPVEELGRALREDPIFSPEGRNVSFLQIETPQRISVRTYERGVEGETLACGTAAVASAFVAHQVGRLYDSVDVLPRSKEAIHVKIGSSLEITGPARFVFHGAVSV